MKSPIAHPGFAQEFADEWIAAWNALDLDRVLSHYSDDFEMISPLIIKTGEPSGSLKGKSKVEAYWRAALEKLPAGAQFELIAVTQGVDGIVLVYRSFNGQLATEYAQFGDDGKVVRAAAYYLP